MDPLRLFHVVTVPESLGFLEGQPRELIKRGYEVHVVSAPGPLLDQFGAEEGAFVHPLDLRRAISPLADLVSLYRLVRLFLQYRPTIVHSHTPKGGLIGTLAAWIARVPVRIYHMRGLPFVTVTGIRRFLLRLSERVACSCAHRVLAVSRGILEIAVGESLCPRGRGKVLHSGSGQGVDAAGLFNPANLAPGARDKVRSELDIPLDAPVIGFVGRVVKDKGVEELVEAFTSGLGSIQPSPYLLVIGWLEGKDAISPNTLQVLHSDPRIRLIPPIPKRELPPYYSAMDLVALPSYREGFPNVPLEAAAMGLPVVTTDVPGCNEALEDGVTGTLVPARDSRALASGLALLLMDSDMRYTFGAAGRRRAALSFGRERLCEAILEEYGILRGAVGRQ